MRSTTAETSPIAGRFVLESEAGSGGMGTVYRARDALTDRTVALKLLHPGTSLHGAERFAREAELLAALRHPGIVTYLAHGETDTGQAYLAMEWLDGEDLAQRLRRGPLSLPEALVLLRRAADALALAHARGVVHRDLKPSNLFLRGGEVERVAVLDFGIAWHADVSQMLTKTGAIIGTPAYMAPEQARGDRKLTAAADIFSLGCVLFECLTGQSPFAADRAIAVLARILFDEPLRLHRLRPEMPEAIDVLLGRMLAKEAAGRLADAAALLAVLDTLDQVRLSAPRAELSAGGEQQLLSVLMAAPPPGVHPVFDSLESTVTGEQFVELHRELSDLGVRLEVLADGSLAAMLRHTRGAATDHAALAARCALLIKAHWPAVTIALGTGSGLLDEHTPAGQVFDRTAALLRDHAGAPASEQILLDEATRGLLEVRFVVRQTPTGAYVLTGEELALDASRPLLGKPTPCIGRDMELSMLESALGGCIEEAEPRAVLVTAPPGTGKSRLRHELLRRLEARGDDITLLIGRGDPMSAGSSYSLLGQALRRLCGIVDAESREAKRDRLVQRIGERIAVGERERVVVFVGELCGVPFPDAENVKLRAARQDPQLMSDQITQAMLDVLRAECAARPVLLVLEDLHWGDALTVKLVDTALQKLKTSALMVLALARPEVNELYPRLWPDAAQVVMLRPLGKKAGQRLVQEVLGEQVPEETVARIVEQSQGNALLLEELIRAVAEGRGDGAPETVLALLQARIGRVETGARRVLRAASVFGETCWRGGIRALIGGLAPDEAISHGLNVLLKEEILEERPQSRFPAEREYRFRHVLMRDAAYGLLSEGDRVSSHRIAGEYLEVCGESDALVLAQHFLQGEHPARAIHYFIQAAEQSYEAYDLDAAMASAKRGLACGAEGEQRGALLSVHSGVHQWREQRAELIELGTEALDLLPEGSKRWCRVCYGLFAALMMTQPGALLGHAERFARAEPAADARGEYVKAATWVSAALGAVGLKDTSRAFLKRAQQVGAARDPSDMAMLGYVKGAEAFDHSVIEDAPWSQMLRSAESQQAAHTAGNSRHEIAASSLFGAALMQLGDRVGAEACLRKALAQAEQLNEALLLVSVRGALARLLATFAPLDQLDDATQLAVELLADKNLMVTGVAYGILAEIKRRQGDLAGAEQQASTACQMVRMLPAYAWEIIALTSRIVLEQGRAEEALAIAQDGVQQLEALGLASFGEIALRLALSEALHAAGRIDNAHAALKHTVERLRPRLDDIPDAAARERYLTQVPANARLVALAKQWLGLDVLA